MRSRRWAMGTLVALGVILARPAGADAQVTPTVSVAPGATTSTAFFGECSDAGEPFDASNAFVITRDVGSAAQDVGYTTGGSAVPGVDYQPLSGVATIPAGELNVTVPVTALTNTDRSRLITLSISITAAPGYNVGDPATATIKFISRRDPSLPPYDCNPGFQLTDAPSNTEQTIALGDVPAPIQTTYGTDVRMQLVEGALPPGVTLVPASGFEPSAYGVTSQFAGGATEVGTFVGTLRLCPPEITFTCRTTTLTIHVLARRDALARTGERLSGEALAGCALIAVGLVMLAHVRRRPRTRT